MQDVVIIGAGIAGAGVAEIFSNKGYSCVLLEQFNQSAQGTSSKSSKLIHGGLRYLENFEFSLVKECLDEREYLCKNVPELVKLESFYIPIYKNSKRKAWVVRIGLILYSLFSKKGFSSVDKKDWDSLDIDTKNLVKVYKYKDGVTDDKALTQYFINKSGCEVKYNSKVLRIKDLKDCCVITYKQEDEIKQIKTKMVINTGGPWVNEVLENTIPKTSTKDISLVLGTHILIDVVIDKIYYIEANDGRAIFVRPYKKGSLIGTTEVPYKGNPSDITLPEGDTEYLIDNFNSYFNNKIGKENVIDSFTGARVLPSKGKNEFKKSREVIIHNDKKNTPNIYSIYGGKLTSFRATAKKVFKKVNIR
ncbi:MAG: Aerobic glycerol-3-phosphate dehydrogenase (EC [uncultured Campylobacterales bacterium]|uniref:Aerobic glycerol-3-phosphate dehydrogenase (EC) n=1 Tax=uncultured Campylobacterales bacterium TaxID=352960 RepID=A0A6S6S5J2_9BACT|nr:MAG: Aerobic glycerol-3-phosphate dehydrogenase (EC [uncultured Campylobacterales bacterium]